MLQNNYERHDYCDEDGDIMKKVHVEVLDFDGRIDPKVFLDWLASLDRYFDWHGISNGKVCCYETYWTNSNLLMEKVKKSSRKNKIKYTKIQELWLQSFLGTFHRLF